MSDLKTSLTIDISADAGDVERATEAVEDLGEAAVATSVGTSAVASGLAEVAAGLSDTATGARACSQTLSSAAEATRDQDQAAGEVSASLRRAAAGLVEAAKAAAQGAKATEAHARVVEGLRKAEEDAAKALDKKIRLEKAAASALVHRTKLTAALAREQKRLGLDASGFAAYRGAARQSRRGELGWADAVGLSGDLTRGTVDQAAKLQQAAAPLMGLSRSVFGGLSDIVSSAASLDAALGDAGWRTGLGQAELSGLVAQAAEGTVASRMDTAQAADELGKLGLGGSIRDGALTHAIDLSTVSGLSAGEAALLIGSGANAIGGDTRRLSRILGASSDSATLGQVMARSGARARAVGWGAADLGAVSEALKAGGVAGEQQGEVINGLVNALGDRSRRGALRRIGVTADNRGSAVEMVRAIADRTAGLDTDKRLERLRKAFGESAPAIAAMVDRLDVLERTSSEFADDDALEKALAKRKGETDGAARAFQELGAALADLRAALTQEVLGALASMVRGIASVIRGVTRLVEAFPILSTVALGAVAGIGALAGAVGGLMSAGAAALSVLSVVKALRVLAALKIWGPLSAGFGSLKVGLIAVGGAVKTALVPMLPLIAAVAAVATVVALVVQNFELLKGALKGGIAMLGLGAVKIAELIQPLLGLVGIDIFEDIAGAREKLAGIFSSAADDIGEWERATDGGRFSKAMNPLNVLTTRETIDQMRQRREEEKQAGAAVAPARRDDLGIQVSVRDDRVETRVHAGVREIAVGANNGLVALGTL